MIAAACLVALSTGCVTQAHGGPAGAPIALSVAVPPTLFRADGHVHLVYELTIENDAPDPVEVTRVDVLAGAGGSGDESSAPLATHVGAELERRMFLVAAQAATPGGRTLAPGRRALVYLWVALESELDVPESLAHRVQFSRAGSPASAETTLGATIPPRALEGAPLGPPLRGGRWAAKNGPSNDSGHRRTALMMEGPRIAQRFAIDWVKIDAAGGTFTGDPLRNASYHCYGAEALAVADGMVAEVKDGLPENVPGEHSRAIQITLENAAGNHVLLDLGSGRFALYAHLQPGSLRVSPGAHVKRGDVLGLVGNSGNSTEPHLHFHVTDGSSPLGSEGLPYHLEAFELLGHDGGPALAAPQHRVAELPLEDWVVRFPDR